MGTNAIIAAIDKELARLHKIKSVLVQKQRFQRDGKKSGSVRVMGKRARRKLIS